MKNTALILIGLILFGSMLTLQGCATGITYVSKEKDMQTGADVYVVRDAITGAPYSVSPASVSSSEELPLIKSGQELLLSNRIIEQDAYTDKIVCVVKLADRKIITGSTDRGLFIMNKDGSNLNRLTFDGYVYNPKFIWNGSKIVFSCLDTEHTVIAMYDTAYLGSKVCIIDPDGSNRKYFGGGKVSLIGNPDKMFGDIGSSYILSPDGAKIAYQSIENDLWGIYVLSEDSLSHKIFEVKDKTDLLIIQKWAPEGIFFRVSPNPPGKFKPIWKWLAINPDGSNLREVSHEYFLSAK